MAAYAQRTPGVELAGVAGYEGGLKSAEEVRKYLAALQEAVTIAPAGTTFERPPIVIDRIA